MVFKLVVIFKFLVPFCKDDRINFIFAKIVMELSNIAHNLYDK